MLGRGALTKKRRPPDLTHQRIKIPNMKKNIEDGDKFTLPSRFALFFIFNDYRSLNLSMALKTEF
jgi:hypothetical protein